MIKQIALLSTLILINSCTLFTKLKQPDIIKIGEKYVLEQGYSNHLLDTNNSKVVIGIMEQYGSLTDIIKNRHNLLKSKAKYIKPSKNGWFLGFVYQNETYNLSDNEYIYCKTIWLSKKGKHIYMVHENMGFRSTELIINNEK